MRSVTPLTPKESVAAALVAVDRKIDEGYPPNEAIRVVAEKQGVDYLKLEHFYIERGRSQE